MLLQIEAANLRIAYDDFVAVDFAELNLRGSIIAVLGHNGAGKSTLIKSALGLLPPKSGSLRISELLEAGGACYLMPDRHMAFCPESGSVFEDISVEDYVRLWCRIKHREANYYRHQGAKYIELLALQPLFSKLGRELSKGQRRRVQTAIGFLCQPRAFLFDEPFDGLDVQKTSELADIIRQESNQMAFIISSHRMDVMERLADSAVVLKHGSLAAAGSIDEVSRSLCRRSVIISGAPDYDLLVKELRQAFPNYAICRIGNQISVSGGDLCIQSLKGLVSKLGSGAALLEECRPSLTDAMNYHLKSMAGETTRGSVSAADRSKG